DERIDDYFWLRDKADPEVAAYLEAENAYAEAMAEHLAPLREALYAEMLGRIKEDDETVPYREGPFFYYSRTEKGKQYPLLCRKRGSLEALEEAYLDLNVLAAGHPFLAIGPSDRTRDGRLLAYGLDTPCF